MPRHPVTRVHADRGHLAARSVLGPHAAAGGRQRPRGPDPGEAGPPLARHAQLRQCDDQGFLNPAEIPVEILPVALEIHDRVADELARTVEGHITAALHLEQFDTALRQRLGGRQQVLSPGRAPERHDGRMLDEQ